MLPRAWALALRAGSTRRWLVAGVLILLMLPALAALHACAHVAAPRGGAPDTIPPLLIALEPDSFAVVPGFDGEVRFEFNESISERNFELAVILYPYAGRARVKKGGSDIRVRPRVGWVEGRIYHIVVDSLVQDLFDNHIEPIRFVFSTGLPIPSNGVGGQVFDRVTGERLPFGRVDLVLFPDTLRYGTVADSGGLFSLTSVPTGQYFAIGYQDVNNNRRADAFDRSDTITVDVGAPDTLSLTFNVFHHDTIGPRLSRARPIDSVTADLQFDAYLDAEVPVPTANVEILSLPDTVPIALDTVLHDWEYQVHLRTRAQEQREAEEAAAEDTLAEERPPALADTLPGERPPAPTDTLAREPPPPAKPSLPGEARGAVAEIRPLPARRIVAVARAPIPPGAYLVRVRRILNLSGFEGGGEVEYEQPAPEPETPEKEPPDQPPGKEP